MMQIFKSLARQTPLISRQAQARFATAAGKGKKEHEMANMSYYDVIGVSPRASSKEIKMKYLQLAKHYHPDVYKGTDTDRFKYIQKAFETLKSPEKRRDYDDRNEYKTSAKSEDFHEKKYEYKGEHKSPFEDIKVNDDLDFDEEYAKFFGKKPEINPESIIPQEHVFLEQLSHEERLRFEYVQYKNNQDFYHFKHEHQLNYHDLINENIRMINTNAMMTDEVKKYKQADRDRKDKRYFNIIKFLIFLSFFPIASALYRRKKVYEMMHEDAMELIALQEQEEDAEIRKRFVF